jgi:hypothetical protein
LKTGGVHPLVGEKLFYDQGVVNSESLWIEYPIRVRRHLVGTPRCAKILTAYV